MRISLSFYVFFISSLSIPLVGMEPVDLANDQEAVPLLEQVQEAQDVRLQMDMEEDDTNLDEQKPVLFDGTRRFYDEETRIQVKKRAIKQCLKSTAVQTITGTSFAMLIFYFVIYYFLSKHYEINPLALDLYASCSASIFVLYSLLFSFEGYLFIIRPAIAEETPFSSHYNLCGRVEKRITIPQSIIDSADITKNIPIADNYAESLHFTISSLLFKKLHYDKLRRSLFSRENYEFYSAMLEHLKNPKITLREHYRNLAYQIKKLLVLKLPREIVGHIFSKFPNNNILEHMMSHCPQNLKDKKILFLNEKELLLLLQKNKLLKWQECLEYGLSPYLAASILEENGWIAFSKSKKYSIRCNMKFFVKDIMPNHMNYYFAKFSEPTIYLPYSLQLAHYYKFEDDPAYTLEHIAPTNRKIERLLQLRQEIIGRNPALVQPIQNNNNN